MRLTHAAFKSGKTKTTEKAKRKSKLEAKHVRGKRVGRKKTAE